MRKFTNHLVAILFLALGIVLCHCTDTAASSDHSGSKVVQQDPLAAGWKGTRVCELIEDNNRVRVLKCTFAPGVGHERHFHAAHFGYTIAGSTFRITDTTGTREVQVPTGSHFYNDHIAWHEVLNVGDSTAVFLIMEPKE